MKTKSKISRIIGYGSAAIAIALGSKITYSYNNDATLIFDIVAGFILALVAALDVATHDEGF